MESGNSLGLRGDIEKYLSVLPSVHFYNIMKTDYNDLSNYSQQCDTDSVHLHKNEAKQICEKILRYLHKHTTLIDDKTEYDVCILLNYWIYDELTNIFGDEYILDKFDFAFSSLQYIWNYPNAELKNTPYYNKCKPNFDIFKPDDWKRRRELYEYYVDYKTMISTAKSFDNVCKAIYKKIEEKKDLYEYFGNICRTKSDDCPEFYNDCIPYNPTLVLPTLTCPDNINPPRVLEVASQALSTHHTLEQEEETGPLPYNSDTELMQQNSDIGTKVGKSVLGIAPIALTASAVYRFTPLGQWIRKLAGSNHNITGNGFGDEAQESENMFFDGSENYISYQPI
ncbi:PIR Superfamily Protein [Plasmodium ovale wallikeri]|uniref:PIR Superfamily Protein n=1 Tax=Plasmodium ovale wallikeri TaxID=864142 RepID=A0A1A9ACT6_PLAOA|nr:PIR Superfamily Protein [Plasmodium ovale wallikeri]SBT58671.1 PIR Superfamily Protein [Plasmodium ovale wallikeri]